MPVLTGVFADVTGQPVPASAIRQVTVTAPAPRANGAALITTRPVPVDHAGSLTVHLAPGRATLTAHLEHATCTFDLLVEAGMSTIHDAALAALGHRR